MTTKKTPGIKFNVNDDAHRAAAVRQRQAILDAADSIEADRAPDEPRWTAAVLRWAAERIPLEQPRKRGAPPRIDHGSLALRFAWLKHHEKASDREAVMKLEAEFGISWQAVDAALTDAVKAEALRQFEGARLLKTKKGR